MKNAGEERETSGDREERETFRATPADAVGGRFGPAGGVIYDGPFSGASSAVELRCWRLFGAELMPLLEAALAAQGEAPDRQILKLQHALAELLAAAAPAPDRPLPSGETLSTGPH